MEQRVSYDPRHRARSRLGRSFQREPFPAKSAIPLHDYQSVIVYNRPAWSWLLNSNALWRRCVPRARPRCAKTASGSRPWAACNMRCARRATQRFCTSGAHGKVWSGASCVSPSNPPGRVVLDVSRFGRARHAKLEFLAGGAAHEDRRWGREQFRTRLHQLLTDRFPDEIIDSLATSADLHHSISGSYTRGLMHRGSDAYAVLSAAPEEDAATIDGTLTFGLIWLDWTRERARGQSVRGLRLFLPRGTSGVTAHRLTALAAPQEIELYEYDPLYWRMR